MWAPSGLAVCLALLLVSQLPTSSTAPAAAPTAAGQQQQKQQQKPAPDYASVFVAMLVLPETKLVSSTYFNTFQALGSENLMSYFKDILSIAQNPSAKATYFWPIDTAWDDLPSQLCMSKEMIQDTLKSTPSVAAAYLKLIIVPNQTVMSDEFKDGMRLQTMQPGFQLVLKQVLSPDGGPPKWRLPGRAYNGSDVTIVRTNVTAGNAVIHFTNAIIVDKEQAEFWTQQRDNRGKQACESMANMTLSAAAAAADSGGGGSSVSPGTVAAIVVPVVIAAALIIAGALFMTRRKQQLRTRLSGEVKAISGIGGTGSAAIGMSGFNEASAGPGGRGLPGIKEGESCMLAGVDQENQLGLLSAGDDDARKAHSQYSQDQQGVGHVVNIGGGPNPPLGIYAGGAAVAATVAAGVGLNSHQPPHPSTPNAPASLARSVSGTAGSEESASATGSSVPDLGWDRQQNLQSGDEQLQMTPVFEANPAVADVQLMAWLDQCAGRGRSQGGVGAGGTSSSSSTGGAHAAAFAEQLRRELDPQTGNPNIINNYINFTREVEHSRTAVYFCDGMHNLRQFALKFYAKPADFQAEMQAYKALGGLNSKYVPTLEMSYPGNDHYPTSLLVFERGQCTLEKFSPSQRPSYFQQVDIFHQLVSAVQYLHDAGWVHRDMKPSNVVHFPDKFAWKLIDLATIARAGVKAEIVYTREYCSPEVAQAVVRGDRGMVVNPATDMWGVGVIMYEVATGQRFFPREWSADGGRRIWAALCGFEPLPSEEANVTNMPGVDKGLMRQVRRLLQRNPELRPTPRQLLAERIFQSRGNTTTQISQGSNVSHGSGGSGGFMV